MIWSLVAGVIGLAFAVYAFLIEPFQIRVTRVEVPIPNLPAELDGLTICHLTDTHTQKYGRLEKKAAGILSQIQADLCVLTGDLISSIHGVQALERMLGGFKPRLGTFAVLGNNDHKLSRMVEIPECLSNMGITLLVNSHQTIQVDGGSFSVIGVDDPFKGRDDLARATAGLEEDGFRLLLAHSPDILAEIDGERVDLILAGHTHGGQVRAPFLRALSVNSSRKIPASDGYFDSPAISRLLGRDVSGVRMYVSRGVGTSGIVARFACPPEIALITLKTRFEAD